MMTLDGSCNFVFHNQLFLFHCLHYERGITRAHSSAFHTRYLYHLFHTMPLVIVTGIPSSGKSRTTQRLKTFLEEEKGKKVKVVEESYFVNDKNIIFADSRAEKEVRGNLKSEAVRLLNKEDVIILDALNYIKGYRYELYCASKLAKTTQVTIHCDVSPEDAWQWNCTRPSEEQYSKEIFDGLVMRYETPNGQNRWDSPLLLSLKEIPLDLDATFNALYARKPPPPNQSTQCQPLSSTTFLYELDRVTKAIVAAVVDAQKSNWVEGDEILVPGTNERVIVDDRKSMAELSRVRRQFIVYAKARAIDNVEKLASMFVQYLNKSFRGNDPELDQ